MNIKINLIAEMVLGLLSADGRLSRSELRTLKRLAPQYLDRIDQEYFDRVINGFNGNPEFLNCAHDLKDQLSNDEKANFYKLFMDLAVSDELDHTEEELLNKLIKVWDLDQ
jgi:uncharacterized tellurite resistance protein B-like protein